MFPFDLYAKIRNFAMSNHTPEQPPRPCRMDKNAKAYTYIMNGNTEQGTSKVFFTDFRCRPDEGRTDKLKRLIKAAGIDQIDMEG